jgi:hypothetical protein
MTRKLSASIGHAASRSRLRGNVVILLSAGLRAVTDAESSSAGPLSLMQSPAPLDHGWPLRLKNGARADAGGPRAVFSARTRLLLASEDSKRRGAAEMQASGCCIFLKIRKRGRKLRRNMP